MHFTMHGFSAESGVIFTLSHTYLLKLCLSAWKQISAFRFIAALKKKGQKTKATS